MIMTEFLFLSRLLLNPRNAQVRKETALPYEMHRTLLSGFPQGKVHVERTIDDAVGMLFRLDEEPHQGLLTVLVQSRAAPDWGFLLDKRDSRGQPYLLPNSVGGDKPSNPAIIQFDLAKKLSAGQTLAFRLRANPTVKKDRPGARQGRRVGITDENKQLEWLRRKAEQGGFRILQAYTHKDGRLTDEPHKLEHFSVQFDGTLLVTDALKLADTVASGIGSAKSFGFGLLSLAPA
jgi:CRISPR system Cascade subunit CasE